MIYAFHFMIVKMVLLTQEAGREIGPEKKRIIPVQYQLPLNEKDKVIKKEMQSCRRGSLPVQRPMNRCP